MELGELITALEQADARLVVPSGFANPHSYRGYYDELAFEPASNVTVAAMLADARSALGTEYQGYKGGDFTMREHTDCWLATWGGLGETLGPTLLRLMLAAGTIPGETADQDNTARLAEVTANIDGYIETKATEIAAARITAAEDTAEEKVTGLMAAQAAEVQRLEDLIAELRRQQKAFDKHLEECPQVLARRERIRAFNAGEAADHG